MLVARLHGVLRWADGGWEVVELADWLARR